MFSNFTTYSSEFRGRVFSTSAANRAAANGSMTLGVVVTSSTNRPSVVAAREAAGRTILPARQETSRAVC